MKRSIQLSSLKIDKKRKGVKSSLKEVSDTEIAIIGMAARLPGAADLNEFWDNLRAGREQVDELSDIRKTDVEAYLRFVGEDIEDLQYIKGALLQEIDTFDYNFFKIPPKEASLMNPIHRLFLETAWSAFEDANYTRKKLFGTRTGIYLGLINDKESYKYHEMIEALDDSLLAMSAGGNILSMIPSRISYALNLKGPSLVVDTACSSSLVALDLACKALRNGECDMAMVGGARTILFPLEKPMERIGFESSDGRTRAFDDGGDGSGVGEGIVALLLKPLSKAMRDGDRIHAVIKGSASNQDGTSMGITAPNPHSQSDLLIEAWKDAGIDAETISYIEAHGTGTRIGDPIEIEGITMAFRRLTNRRQFCAIGSVKANLGHLYASAGLVGVVKAVLSLRHRQIPALINFSTPNKEIDFVESPIYVNTRHIPWESDSQLRRCGVSSFGLSGTNCHVVLEEAPAVANQNGGREEEAGSSVLVLSAKSKAALRKLVTKYRKYLDRDLSLNVRDVCYTAGVGREHHELRIAVMTTDASDLRSKLTCLETLDDLYAAEKPWLYVGLSTDDRNTSATTNLQTEDKTTLVREYIQQFRETGKIDEKILGKICSLYVSGAEIDWEEFYRGERLQKVNLPTYPFDPTRCWLEFPIEEEGTKGRQLGRNQSAGDTERILQELSFFSTKWERTDIDFAAEKVNNGAVLLLSVDAESIWEMERTLREQGRDVIVATVSGTFTQHSESHWQLSGSQEDYERLFHATRNRGISEIVHLLAWNDRSSFTDTPQLENGVLNLYRMVRALASNGLKDEVDITVVSLLTDSVVETDQPINPHHAAMKGLLEVVAKEISQVRCKWLDLDDLTHVDVITEELRWGSKDKKVAYRQGIRYVEEFDLVDQELLQGEEILVRSEGIYLISGGLGGIGLELAQYLVSRNSRAKIALIGRSGLPPREQWAELETKGSIKVRRAVTAIKEMEARGAEISVLSIDVTNFEQMTNSLELLRRKYGRINGVIHAAGIGKEVPLLGSSESEFQSLLLPKIVGTWILDRLTRQDQPDFFVLCSSVASIFSGPNQGGYVAANAFLDAYASYRSTDGLPTLTINWTTWKETGMAFDQGWASDTIFNALPTTKAIEGFRAVLGRPIHRVLIGELNLDGGIALLEASGVRLSKELERLLEQVRPTRKTQMAPRRKERFSGTVKLIGRDREEYTVNERFIANICMELLGHKEIDVNENFLEMGADSIVLTRIAERLEERFPGKIHVTNLFEHSTIAKLAVYLTSFEDSSAKNTPRIWSQSRTNTTTEDIAIIGIGIKLPQANSLDEFWENISRGVNSVSQFPEGRRQDIGRYLEFMGFPLGDVTYLDGAYLEDAHKFDYNFFGIPPREAVFMDIHQRLFLQTAWHAIEDAGYGGGKIAGTETGVFLGLSTVVRDMYAKILYDIDPSGFSKAIVGSSIAVVAGRISYMLDLHGPSMVLDTACSSGLVALDTACQAIRANRCSMALVGGIKLSLAPIILNGKITGIGMESSDGLTRAFDEYSDGTVFGEGSQVILIKPLEKAVADGDHIYGVIKGSAVNQDGSSAGITAPNPEAQLNVLLQAWEEAGIDPETISYIEAHGTGTQLGDPIEISSIQNAFRSVTDKKHFCAVGSVKTNLGHLAEGAGLVGLIKCILAMKYGEIPASLNFNRPNPKIDFVDSPVYVNTRLREWNTGSSPKRCAVSAFGMSGTNSHVVLEEYVKPSAEQVLKKGPQIFVLSAKSPESLTKLVAEYTRFLERHESIRLNDLCYTASTGRGHYQYRLALVVNNLDDLKSKLTCLSHSAFEQVDEKGLFYGEHRIVSADKESRSFGELIEQEKYELTVTAVELIERIQAGERTEDLLSEICSLYVKGADIDWEQMYADDHCKKMSLPVYPFEPTQCWVDIPSPAESVDTMDTLFYTVKWKPGSPAETASILTGTAVVLTGSGSELGSQTVERLRMSGMDVVEVRSDKRYEQIDEYLFTISEEVEDYNRLFNELANRDIRLILHMNALAVTKTSLRVDELDANVQMGVSSAVSLTKALSGTSKPVNLYFIAPYVHEVTGDEQQIIPEHGVLFGLAKSIGPEYRHITCHAIDVDNSTTVDQLLSELQVRDDTFVSAYRNGVRYVEEFSEVDIDSVPERNLTIKRDGVYVITGGLGGIGAVMAKYLASKVPVRLALINRTPLPDRVKWDDILADGQDEKLCRRITIIKELESAGSTVAYYAADVANPDELATVLADIRSQFGQIDGVIHGAGVANPGMLIRKPQESLFEVLEPKVRGTWLLDHLTGEDELDFFVLFSSAVTLIGEAGQADYVAANYYQDCYAVNRNKRYKNTIVIDWVSWADAGMAVEFQINVDTLFKALPSTKAVEAFDTLLSRDLTRAVVGEFNTEAPVEILESAWAIPCQLSDRIVAVVKKLTNSTIGRTSATNRADLFVPLSSRKKIAHNTAPQAVKLAGRDSEDYSELEKKIAHIFGAELGFDNIDIYDSFFELGGDSIMLSRIHMELEKEFPGQIKLVELFEYTSVVKLAQYLREKMMTKDEPTQPKNDEQVENELKDIIEKVHDGEISIEEALRNLENVGDK